MKIRIKFCKYGNMRFVGHLDLMRSLQRAFRRAGLDMTYSEGFNPHPLMSAALPLGIGLTSEGEYLDLTLNTSQPSSEAIQSLNKVMPEGVLITGYRQLPEEAKKAMACVSAADYVVGFKYQTNCSENVILREISAYYTRRESIPVTKKTKKSERELDLKPLIYQMRPFLYDSATPVILQELRRDNNGISPLYDTGDCVGLFLRLSAGSRDNIRPDLVLEDLCAFEGKSFDPLSVWIHRTELYENTASDEVSPIFVPLGDAGKDII